MKSTTQDRQDRVESMNDKISALIIAKPGPLRNGLHAFLTAIPRIGTVTAVDDVASALQTDTGNLTAFVLLDSAAYDGGTAEAVRQVRARWPETGCIVLVDDIQQQREAEDTEADGTLIKGSPAAKLYSTIERLLIQQGEQRRKNDVAE